MLSENAKTVFDWLNVYVIFGEDIKYLADPNNLLGMLGLLGAVVFWSMDSL